MRVYNVFLAVLVACAAFLILWVSGRITEAPNAAAAATVDGGPLIHRFPVAKRFHSSRIVFILHRIL